MKSGLSDSSEECAYKIFFHSKLASKFIKHFPILLIVVLPNQNLNSISFNYEIRKFI